MLNSETKRTLHNATTSNALPTYSRPLSDNEQSYYLQSRENGANDMILETEFRAPAVLVTHRRMSLVWAILRLQHPLLAATVDMEPGNYQSCAFVYTPPPSPTTALLQAESCIESQWRSPDDDPVCVGSQGPGDRRLSSNTLSYVVFQSQTGDTKPTREYRIFFHYAHCCMDGVAMHLITNAFLVLLGGSRTPGQPPSSDGELERLLMSEWAKRWSSATVMNEDVIPMSAEERLPQLTGQWRRLASKIEHSATQKRVVGGHTFPRKSSSIIKCTSRMVIYSVEDTRTILTRCRAARVTISNALFAICNMAWIRVWRDQLQYNPKLPTMIYSAVSLRHFFTTPKDNDARDSALLQPSKTVQESRGFLALSYFNAMLPGFIPSGSVCEAAVMWHRARCVRDQFAKYSQSPMFIPRVHSAFVQRGERARRFAKEDDEALFRAQGSGPAPALAPVPASSSTLPAASATSSKPQSAPSIALIGLSQLGNLDQFYDIHLYPSLDMLYVQGHTRKNRGGILMLSHTFRGRLALQLGWDEAGFQPGVVEAFWSEVDACVREYMIDAPPMGGVKVKL